MLATNSSVFRVYCTSTRRQLRESDCSGLNNKSCNRKLQNKDFAENAQRNCWIKWKGSNRSVGQLLLKTEDRHDGDGQLNTSNDESPTFKTERQDSNDAADVFLHLTQHSTNIRTSWIYFITVSLKLVCDPRIQSSLSVYNCARSEHPVLNHYHDRQRH